MAQTATKNIIIGTAGHVDHGKTALIHALTGADTDRLKEEKQRGISIDLGFASFTLPNGDQAGVIDVPGHEKFINNMLAGVGGIDLVLLVVDCMEGVMPQTHEHLQILNLLQIPRGIVVLTKVDLAEEEWIDIVEEEIRDEVATTFLQDAPFCRVSSVTGQGIAELTATIAKVAEQVPQRDSHGPMRLPIDRHFSVAGFGTVITGTLLTGSAHLGDNVEVLPAQKRVRIRDIQVHGKKHEVAHCGQRVALNLAGLERSDIMRGSVVATPGIFEQTNRLDARLTLLADAPRAVKFRDPVHFYLGTARVVGLVALLDCDQLEPGETALVQIHLDRPLVAHRQDRFIIRSYSPMFTIGGGVVIDPDPVKHKRFRSEVMQQLKELESGEGSFLLQKLSELQCARIKELEQISGMGRDKIASLLAEMQDDNRVMQLADQWLPITQIRLFKQQMVTSVEQFHQANPLLPGIPHATLKARLPKQLSGKAFDQLLADTALQRAGEWVQVAGFTPQPSAAQQSMLDKIESLYRQAGVLAKGRREMLDQLGIAEDVLEDCLGFLFFNNILIKLNDETFFHRDSYNKALRQLVAHFAKEQSLTLGEYRDLIGSARKPVQALLEYFDQLKYTMRQGDARQAWKLPTADKIV
ncbi:MAG: selenocysteine-specific translation elongation factor [Desulfuromonas sp.]|nr:selenocysteine-specific translation elongation factor [Desulfuromonas sp.]